MTEFGIIVFFPPLFFEDADLLEVLNAFDEFGEADAAAASRINHKAVPGRPGAETGIGKRIHSPAVVGPAEVAVIVLGLGEPAEPCGLVRV